MLTIMNHRNSPVHPPQLREANHQIGSQKVDSCSWERGHGESTSCLKEVLWPKEDLRHRRLRRKRSCWHLLTVTGCGRRGESHWKDQGLGSDWGLTIYEPATVQWYSQWLLHGFSTRTGPRNGGTPFYFVFWWRTINICLGCSMATESNIWEQVAVPKRD